VAVNLKYGAEALALVGIAYGLIKWVGRSLRSLVSDPSFESSRLEALAAANPDAGADALVRQGIVSAEDLSGMSPREREFLVATAGLHLESSTGRGARRPTPRSMGVVSGPGALPSARGSAGSPRLHLITPSRPPLGVAVHCPGCGALLDREALQRVGATTCSRCKRPVSAHIQRSRLTVIIEETAEEAEHRRRLDGVPPER
jgi:hypothetical protein